MKTALAWVGGAVLVLALLGALGLGHFVLRYGPEPTTCEVKS